MNQVVKHSSLDIDDFDFYINDLGFVELDQSKKGSLTPNGIDQAYFNLSDPSQIVILKFDIVLSDKKEFLKLNNTDYVCHGVNSRKRNYALFFSGIKQEIFQQTCNKLKDEFNRTANQASHFSGLNNKFLITYEWSMNQAYAKDHCSNQSAIGLKKNQFAGIDQVHKSIQESQVFKQLGTCFSSILRGATQSIDSTFESVKKLFTTSPSDLWDSLKQQAIEMKNFVMNIKEQVLTISENLKKIDVSLIVQMGCQLIGEVIVQNGLSALTGFGAIKIINLLKQSASKIKKVESLFQRLNSLVKMNKNHLAEKVLSCAM